MQLPLNCKVEYFESFLSKEEADEIYHLLINDYQLDKARLIIKAGGQLVKTDSFKIFFATNRLIESNSHPEEIHGKSFPWKGAMAKLRNKVEQFLNKEFELAMCLYYPNGNFFAPFHSDQETSGNNTILPSLSLGEVREFAFKSNHSDEYHSLMLANGSMLVMGNNCQSYYQHSLLKNPSYLNPRINITFREPGFK